MIIAFHSFPHLLYARMWISRTTKKRCLDCIQVCHDSPDAPLLPPDTIIQSRDISIDGSPRSTKYKDAIQARNEYQKLRMEKSSVRRHRKFLFGSLYDTIFPGCYVVDPLDGDFDLVVTLDSKEKSVLQVRGVSPDDGVGAKRLLSSVLDLGRSLYGPGNARGTRVGDIGSMHAFGLKSVTTKELYVMTESHATKVKLASSLMRHWMEDNMRDSLKCMMDTDKNMGIANSLPFMPNGPGSRLMVSVNLGNSAHYDVGDSSVSVAVWVEEKPNQSKNWYFVLPNMSYKGSKGVIVKLVHGVVISWDAKQIFHCTSKTMVGNCNKTYGCMWGSSRS